MVATATLITSTRGAELIREQTGRSCSRQNLENLCRRGRLPRSCVSTAPIRLNPASIVEEYLSTVDPRQQPAVPRQRERKAKPQPSILDRPPESVPTRRQITPDELPDYNVSRARSEYEKANLLELERQQKEGLLLPREDVEQAWNQAVNLTRTKLLGVASTVKQRIPHLEPEEVTVIRELIREALEELASGQVAA